MKKYVVSIFLCLNIFMYSSSFASVRSFGHCTKVVTCQIPNTDPYPECVPHCSFYVADADTDDFSTINAKIICEDDGFFCKLNWSGNPHTTISQAEGDKFCKHIFKHKRKCPVSCYTHVKMTDKACNKWQAEKQKRTQQKR